jgi:hypothetical protein
MRVVGFWLPATEQQRAKVTDIAVAIGTKPAPVQ